MASLSAIARRALVLLALCLAQGAWAQPVPEISVKAALLYKFASYVEWPPDAFAAPDAPFVIGIIGAEELAGELEQLVRSRTINNRRILVRRVKEGETLAGIHMLFVGGRDLARIRGVAQAARPLSVLVVTDTERGLEAGGVINFVPVEDRVGFEISVDAAERSALRVSSRMLGVARRVLGAAS